MAPSIHWGTKVITIPQADLTLVSGSLYELDVDVFRLALKNIEDSEDGMAHLDTHRHNTAVTLSGVTYARTFEIINGYTVTFEDTGSPYTVRAVGANHNLADVTNFTSEVSLIVGNSAGLVSGGSGGVTSADVWQGHTIESTLTPEQALRVILAAISGRSAGIGTTQEKYKSVNGVKDRITVDFDAQGNRDTVTLDGT